MTTTRRIHAVLTNNMRGFEAAVREGLSLLTQTVRLVAGKEIPALSTLSRMPLYNSMGLLNWAQTVNAVTEDPVDISTGSHRKMVWLQQRIETSDGKYAIASLYVYWDRPDSPVLFDVQGEPEALALCTIDSMWVPTDEGYSPSGEPMSLERAIAAAADHS